MVGQVIAVDGEADPNEQYRGTRWTRIAQGRVLAGIGTGTDSNGATRTFTSGDNPGEYAHTSTLDETASHAHRVVAAWDNHVTTHARSENVITGFTWKNSYTAAGIPDSAQYDVASESELGARPVGGGQPHNNVQPSYGVNWWRRDA